MYLLLCICMFSGLYVLFFLRDAEDHIAWLLEHGWHEKALEAVEAGQGRSELLDEVHFFSPFISLPPCLTIPLI